MSLQGSLDELALTDLVEMISIGRKTGRLTLFGESGLAAGGLSFCEGRMVAAECGQLGAERALYALLELTAGSFEFDPSAPLGDDCVDMPTETLLLEGLRRLDETKQLRARIPACSMVRLLRDEAGDPLEERVLGHLGGGAQRVGDIIDALLGAGDADEYDVLETLARLAARDVVCIDNSST